MQVTARAVRDFLSSGSMLSEMSKDKLSRFLFLYERATKTTSTITGMPGGGGSDHEAVLASLADATDDVSKWKNLAERQRNLVRDFLSEADIKDSFRDLLMKRYYYGDGWGIILSNLQWGKGVSRRMMFYNHNKALQACADWVNKTGKWRDELL